LPVSAAPTEKLKQQPKKVEEASSELRCLKCPGRLETYTFQGFVLERCQTCGGIWMDKGELEGIIRSVTQGPLGHLIDKLLGKEERLGAKTEMDS
jgi:Zn-finger nucleic acid-binding protein